MQASNLGPGLDDGFEGDLVGNDDLVLIELLAEAERQEPEFDP